VSEREQGRIEKIAYGDLQKRNRSLRLIRKWQRRIWKAGQQ
jgi:hypothetical protein